MDLANGFFFLLFVWPWLILKGFRRLSPSFPSTCKSALPLCLLPVGVKSLSAPLSGVIYVGSVGPPLSEDGALNKIDQGSM